jgi:hypothetical protein
MMVRAVLLVGAAAFLVTPAFAADKKDDTAAAPAKKEMSPQEKEMMEKWMAFCKPGAMHEMLKRRVGKWDTVVRMWPAPGAPAQETKGTSEFKAIMGDRYVAEDHQSIWEGMPFTGMGIHGYDNLKKTFVSFWMDNMGTGFMVSEGTANADGKQIVYYGDAPDMMTGHYKPIKMIERMVDEKSWRFEMYEAGPDGLEYKHFECVYTRK